MIPGVADFLILFHKQTVARLAEYGELLGDVEVEGRCEMFEDGVESHNYYQKGS